jgi:hypothetical protein
MDLLASITAELADLRLRACENILDVKEQRLTT